MTTPLLYTYEAHVLKFLNGIVPELTMMTYAKEETIFESLSSITKFPALFYYRDAVQWEMTKNHFVRQGSTSGNYYPFRQTYVGRIVVESQIEAIALTHRLRYGWGRNSYLYVKYPTDEHLLKIALRLLYIKIDEERGAMDKKGSVRYVEFSWVSHLFFEDFYDTPTKPYGLVEVVKIMLGDGYTISVQTTDEDIYYIKTD